MKRNFFFIILLHLTVFSAFAQQFRTTNADQRAIMTALDTQTRQWNAGDIDGFMQGYWHSDSLEFIGSSGITRGWQATLARYKKNYPDRETMGTLRFDILRIELLSPESAFVVGRFHLTRPQKGDAQGYFTLVWRKIGGKWFITTDHTS